LRRIATLALLLAGCGSADGGSRYLDDARFRRDRLVASLVNPQNGYSQLRLWHYASGDDADWDRLPEWNPPVATLDDAGAPRDDERALDLASPALGADAFFRYPVQLLSTGASTRAGALVRVRLADGSERAAMSCATCHARVVDGVVTAGLANETIDFGWGPGRVDVSAPDDEPIAIPDVRAATSQEYLQRDGTVRNAGDLVTLAIRIETLIITSHEGAVRPPRQVSWALAGFLASLEPPLAPPPATASPASRGAALFAGQCAACHQPPAFAGAIVPLDVIGTDPRVGQSADRGTGGYRVPSLRGVATRGRLLHDGSIADLPALFDPARTIPGHRFGLDLSADDRAALLAFLTTL